MPIPSTIAIDGPAAAGKSTIGQLLAKRLDYLYLDTGAMYRAVTWLALEKGVEISDEKAVTRLAHEIKIEIAQPTADDGRQYTVYVDNKDVTWEIRCPEVDQYVSSVSAYPGVREALTRQQRRIGEKGRVVMVGRDIGTVVMPRADVKIYLNASLEERGRRRHLELAARGRKVSSREVLSDMRRRDEYDSHRRVAPLRRAADAHVIDTTRLSVDEVLAEVLALVDNWKGR